MFLVRKYTRILLLTLGLVIASLCQAIGFGELKVYSYLGEPLYAEIELTGYEGIDTDLLKVGLADAKDFARAGIDRPYFLTFLVFQTITYNDKLYIVVRTSKQVQTPFLEFLVELSWPGGNLIKEYTILLDPPPADLKKETRPKGAGQMSEEQKTKTFGESSIQQQMDIQQAQKQKAAAEESLKGVIRESGNKFSDATFDVKQAQAQAAKSAQPSKPGETPLMPGVVPEVVDESSEYQKELQAYKAKEAAKTAQHAGQSLLQETVGELQSANKELTSDLSVQQILAHERKTSGAATTQKEEPVNFGQVITPAGGKAPAEAKTPTAVAAATATPASAAIAPRAKGRTNVPPVQGAAVPVQKSNHMYLGMILSLLLIGAVVAIAMKRGMLDSILHKSSGASAATAMPTPPPTPAPTVTSAVTPPTAAASSSEVPFSDNPNQKLLDEGLEEFAPEDMEHIELSSADQENIEQQIAQTVATTTTSPPPPTTTNANITTPVADAALEKFEQEFENINLDELAPPAPSVTPENEVSMQATAQTATVTTVQSEAPINVTPVNVASVTAGLPPNEVPMQPEPIAPTEPSPNITPPPEYEPEPQEIPQPTPTPEPPPETAESKIEGPTLINDDIDTGSKSEIPTVSLLKDGSSSIVDNAANLRKKLDLAKQYLDSGDKESARDLLREIVEVANDEIKVEAQILLSTIV